MSSYTISVASFNDNKLLYKLIITSKVSRLCTKNNSLERSMALYYMLKFG